MNLTTLLIIVLGLSALGYQRGRQRACSLARADVKGQRLHSQPGYYGWYTALWCGIPAALVLGLWLASHESILTRLLLEGLPEPGSAQDRAQLGLLLNDVRNHAGDTVSPDTVPPELRASVERYQRNRHQADIAAWLLVLSAAITGLAGALRRLNTSLKARNAVEQLVHWALIEYRMN